MLIPARLQSLLPFATALLLGQLPAQDVNLAPLGVATMSSILPSDPTDPQWAIDGNRSGNWGLYSTIITNDLPGSWWQVTLPAPVLMHEVVIYNREDCCPERLANFRVEVFAGSTSVYSQDCFTAGGFVYPDVVPHILLGDGVVADRVRITGLGLNAEGNHFLQFSEVEILQHGPQREVNLGKHAFATMSTTDTHPLITFNAIYAVDGYTGGYIQTGYTTVARTQNLPGSWFHLDIDPGSVNEIRLWPCTNLGLRRGCGNFRVEVKNGSTTNFFADLLPNGDMPANAPTVVTVPSGVSGDAVHITSLGPVLGHEGLEFAEVEVIRYNNATAFDRKYGTACFNSGGYPVIITSSRPEVGLTLVTSVGMAYPTPAFAVLVVGFSHTQSGAVPLPLDMSSFGAPGCLLLASPDITLFGVPGGFISSVQFPMDLPNSLAVVGFHFYEQGLAYDQAANALGAVFTAGNEIVVGL